ncbi:MAG: vitamin K epoxide reductase family protein [Mariprofundaceae bacterium]
MINRRQTLFISILVLTAAGLATSIYLTYLHQHIFTGKLTDFSFCGFSRGISCETVTASPQAEWFSIPLAWYGAMYYLLFMFLGLAAILRPVRDASTATCLILLFSAVAVAIDVYLAYIMAFVIGSLCLLCLLTYILNLAILYLAFRTASPPISKLIKNAIVDFATGRARAAVLLSFVTVAAVGILGAQELRRATNDQLASFNEDDYRKFRADTPRLTVDTRSDPYIGPLNADLTIIEFSDFQCPHCRKAHFILQTILPAYKNRVKLVFKNLPLGMECNPNLQGSPRDFHPSACQLANLGESATKQGKFWPLHDLIFEHQADFKNRRISKDELLNLAKKAGLDTSLVETSAYNAELDKAIHDDIQAANQAGILGTPSFLFNGLLIRGIPSPRVLQRIIDIELEDVNLQ